MNDADALTEKQIEALELVCQHNQTKDIARILGISPRSVDQRLDGARQKLGAATRVEAARLYAAQRRIPYCITGEPLPVPSHPDIAPQAEPSRDGLRFEDAGTFNERAPWDRPAPWRFPELRPRDLGAVARLATMVVLAICLVLLVTLGLDMARSLELVLRG